MHSRVEIQTTYRLVHPFQCFWTDGRTETGKQLALLVLGCSGMKTEAQKVKASIGVIATSLAVFTIPTPNNQSVSARDPDGIDTNSPVCSFQIGASYHAGGVPGQSH